MKPKRPLPALFLGLAAALSCAAAPRGEAAPTEPLRVMSFNVRWGTAPDGPDAWPHRRALLPRVVADHDPAVIGLQEALRFQVDEIWARHGRARGRGGRGTRRWRGGGGVFGDPVR